MSEEVFLKTRTQKVRNEPGEQQSRLQYNRQKNVGHRQHVIMTNNNKKRDEKFMEKADGKL